VGIFIAKVMQLNSLKLKNRRKQRKTIGRGGKKGTYCGKGMKGQKARSGGNVDPLFEGGRSTLIDHMKKKRGFKALNSKHVTVDLKKLDNKFKNGDIINREALIKTGLIDDNVGKQKIKILGKEKIKHTFEIFGILASASAKKAIEEAGGKIAN
jgi:large subunit ribosomal protein L15